MVVTTWNCGWFVPQRDVIRPNIPVLNELAATMFGIVRCSFSLFAVAGYSNKQWNIIQRNSICRWGAYFTLPLWRIPLKWIAVTGLSTFDSKKIGIETNPTARCLLVFVKCHAFFQLSSYPLCCIVLHLNNNATIIYEWWFSRVLNISTIVTDIQTANTKRTYVCFVE